MSKSVSIRDELRTAQRVELVEMVEQCGRCMARTRRAREKQPAIMAAYVLDVAESVTHWWDPALLARIAVVLETLPAPAEMPGIRKRIRAAREHVELCSY